MLNAAVLQVLGFSSPASQLSRHGSYVLGCRSPAVHNTRGVRQPAPLCRAATVQPVFELCIDLGEGNGVVEGELTPLFTRSELVSVRYQVPFALEASADKGVVRIDTAGLGLLAGDVLRACSTLEMRYDSETRTVRLGPGFHGRKRALGQEGEVASRSGARWWERKLRRSVPSALDELGVFIETCPAKVLFIADGQSFAKVEDALTANVPEKTKDVILVFERPIEDSPTRRTEARPLPRAESFSPLTEDDLDGLFRL